MFFEHADCLVGVCKDVTTLSSQLLTISLNDFGDVPAGADDALASPAPSATSKSPGSSGRKAARSELGKRKVVEKPQPRRTKLQSVGELAGEEEEEDEDDDEGAGEEKGALEHE
jgi:hypothetical protein